MTPYEIQPDEPLIPNNLKNMETKIKTVFKTGGYICLLILVIAGAGIIMNVAFAASDKQIALDEQAISDKEVTEAKKVYDEKLVKKCKADRKVLITSIESHENGEDELPKDELQRQQEKLLALTCDFLTPVK